MLVMANLPASWSYSAFVRAASLEEAAFDELHPG